MPIFFNSLLAQFGVAPDAVILLRHQDASAERGRTPYELWRDDRPAFEVYQRLQKKENRTKFSRPRFWASFVVTLNGDTMFVGLYASTYKGLLAEDTRRPHKDGTDLAESLDCYDLRLDSRLEEFYGRLLIEWGDGMRSFVQRAEKQNKQVVELSRQVREDEFPGFLNFMQPLSKIRSLPQSWTKRLKEATGVYLLTCPKTKEQYVGKASGGEGFWHRWMEYVKTGHGGNIKLKSREYSDYQVSILEVAGSGSTEKDILAMESLWMKKLQSREMGLN